MSEKNYSILSRPYPRVKLHPATIKYLSKGHPWITEDSFTKSFPDERVFLIGLEGKDEKEFAIILHDPTHKTVKARAWSLVPPFVEGIKDFPQELYRRLDVAFKVRRNLEIEKERDNYYLVFAEGDRLPGLMIQKLGSHLLIQHYAGFWKKLEAPLLEKLGVLLKDYFPGERISAFIENRNDSRQNTMRRVSIPGIKNDLTTPPNFTLKEFGINYQLHFDQNYDHGLYTDMSAIRKRIKKYIKGNVLNLFSYTGAFSLYSLANGAESVTSIDLSRKYLDWLEHNLTLNPELEVSRHQSICANVHQGLEQLSQDKSQFDLIICDPPTSSSDGKKTDNVLNSYTQLIPAMAKVMAKESHLIVFQNTHQTSKKKFEERITALAKESGLKVVESLKMGEDARPIPQFPEGNYLNGLVLKKDAKN